jgi:hypothetical protein
MDRALAPDSRCRSSAMLFWDNGVMERHCIYCSESPDSLEHPLPVAFGEFRDAPHLEDRICKQCNNRLGLLDEQLTRCGPEALFRRFYGIQGAQLTKKWKSSNGAAQAGNAWT